MSDPGQEAIDAFSRWAGGFNNRDVPAMLAEMHFPHMRLSGSEFQTWETPEDFARPQEEATKQLQAEGWHITITKINCMNYNTNVKVNVETSSIHEVFAR